MIGGGGSVKRIRLISPHFSFSSWSLLLWAEMQIRLFNLSAIYGIGSNCPAAPLPVFQSCNSQHLQTIPSVAPSSTGQRSLTLIAQPGRQSIAGATIATRCGVSFSQQPGRTSRHHYEIQPGHRKKPRCLPLYHRHYIPYRQHLGTTLCAVAYSIPSYLVITSDPQQ